MDVEPKENQSNVKVAVRVRPLSLKEINQGDTSVINTLQNTVVVAKSARQFTFDQVFNMNSSQQELFEKIAKGLVLRCFEGYNSTILAYGQTGSGKTFTMGTTGVGGLSTEYLGLVPRVIYFIFDQLGTRTDVALKVSYLEIYNEQIIDLLDTNAMNLQIREEKDSSISIPGLTEESVVSPAQMLVCLDKGGLNRTTASTNMNERSSRSHAIFTIHFEIAHPDDGSFVTAKFHFVDLAGSERLKKTLAVGQQMAEGININQSLLKLGNVISQLSEKGKSRMSRIHIPYRESKLTRLLQDSLGGNANTYMVACVSPAESNYEETLNSLKYASRAREIENTPTINRDPQSALVQGLKEQIQSLQGELNVARSLLKQHNIKFTDGPVAVVVAMNEEQQDTLKRMKMSLMFYEKQVVQLQAELNVTKTALSESEIQLYSTRLQRDKLNLDLIASNQMLKNAGIPLPESHTNASSQFEEYGKEVDLLRRQLQERGTYASQLQQSLEQALTDQKRDQRILLDAMAKIEFHRNKAIEYRRKAADLESRLQAIRPEDVPAKSGSEAEELEEEEEMHQDPLIKQRKDQFEEAYKTFENELEMVSQEILQKEGQLESMTINNFELKSHLAEEMKREYYQQIHYLEQEKQQIQRQYDMLQSKLNSLDQSERNQVQQLKTKVQQMESKIAEMRAKDAQSKMMQRKMEEQDRQVNDLKQFIERMKKQKLDLQRKLKDEGEKFTRFKDDRYKDILLARKQKCTTDAQLRQIRNKNNKMEFKLKKQEDEISKLKQDQKLAQKRAGKQSKSRPHDELEKAITIVFEQYYKGRVAERQWNRENEKITETLNSIGNEERKMFQLEVRKEQLFYDIAKLQGEQSFDAQQKLDAKQNELGLVEMELNEVNQARESMNESHAYQRRKIAEVREIMKKSSAQLMTYLDSQTSYPGTALKTIKFTIDQWATNQLQANELQAQTDQLQSQLNNINQQSEYLLTENAQLRGRVAYLEQEVNNMQDMEDEPNEKAMMREESFSPGKKPKQRAMNSEQEDLRRQLKDQKRKYQLLENEFRVIKNNQEYYKNLLQRYQSLHQKDKFIGLSKMDSSTTLPLDTMKPEPSPVLSINNIQAMRDRRKQEKQLKIRANTMGDKIQLPAHRSTPSDHKLSKQKTSENNSGKIVKRTVSEFSGNEMQEAWLGSDSEHVNNISTEFDTLPYADLKWELVKSFQAHENAIQSCSTCDNVLYSTAFKQFRVWNLDAQLLISSIDLGGYVRAACYWEERKAIAVAHGNTISLYDQNLMAIGQLKTADEVRVLTKYGPYLVAGGKGTQTNGALTIWDCKMNSPLYEFDKGQDIFSLYNSQSNLYWGTRTHNVRYTNQQFSNVSQLDPPSYDRVTGIGSVHQWLVSCSAGKDMRMWHHQTGLPGKHNSDIHKDIINTMTIDQNLQLIYTGCKDGQLKVIKIFGDKFVQLNDITASTQQINSLTMIQNSNCVVSGGSDKLLKIWRPCQQTTELLRQYTVNLSTSDFQLEDNLS